MASPPSSLQPPTKSGSGAFIGAAIVMLLLMGGLIYWKVSGTDEEPKQAAKPPAPPPTAEEPVLEEPPPPPPPEEPDAGKEEKKVVRASGKAPSGPIGCSGACKGVATAQLRSALRGRAGQARGCYNRALRLNPTLQGRLTVNVRISPKGTVCSAGVGSNSLGDATVASCVAGMFRSASFPAPQGGCVDTAVPMNFVPKKQ